MDKPINLYTQAKKYLPGGVNSPVRAWKNLDKDPIFISCANDAKLTDEQGKQYLDYICSWGAVILGHNYPALTDALTTRINQGLSFGAPSVLETELAHKICSALPSIEKIRLVNSGTEATMSAIRLARGATGRKLIIKFDGCYHGHVDSLLIAAGSGAATHNTPTSAGIPQDVINHTISLPYNDSTAVKRTFMQYGEQIAAVIVEPIAGNMNFVRGTQDFLATLRQACDDYGSLLIFDEVMTGFRVAYGGAQSLYKIQPDLTCLGKIIGGGLPVGALGGKAEIMDNLSPIGNVYQAGTLSGNPIAMQAGIIVLDKLATVDYSQFDKLTNRLTTGLVKIAQQHGSKISSDSQGAMFGFVFTQLKENYNYTHIQQANLTQFKQFFLSMLGKGIYFAPSVFEAGFISLAHTSADIDYTLEAADHVLEQMQA
jgi:glutamate-1-semialdehyde 2,1-aminomutase